MQQRWVSRFLLCVVLALGLAIASCGDPEAREGQACKEGSFHCLSEHTMLVCNTEELVYSEVWCRSMYVDSAVDCYDMICDTQEGCIRLNSPDGVACNLCTPLPGLERGVCSNGICVPEDPLLSTDDDESDVQAEAEAE